jgi:hypothetical protein
MDDRTFTSSLQAITPSPYPKRDNEALLQSRSLSTIPDNKKAIALHESLRFIA